MTAFNKPAAHHTFDFCPTESKFVLLPDQGNSSAYLTGCVHVRVCVPACLCMCDMGVLWLNERRVGFVVVIGRATSS